MGSGADVGGTELFVDELHLVNGRACRVVRRHGASAHATGGRRGSGEHAGEFLIANVRSQRLDDALS